MISINASVGDIIAFQLYVRGFGSPGYGHILTVPIFQPKQ